ncbi:RNA-directed DNA polymerase, eukaryota, reverse transcriptase zinc-binding domain protein [Tanacetum coccineum]
MTRLETFRLKSMWGNYNFDFTYRMARGRSGGLISMWDPNSFIKDDIWCDDAFIIVKGHWRNMVDDCYMINIYGPQDSLAKAILWNRIGDFMRQHVGKYIIVGDMNVVCNENERSGSLFSRHDVDNFNSSIENSGLIDLPLGGRLFTWMNKARTKLSKLDRFLISKGVAEALPDVRVTAIDRLWSNHNLILLQVSMFDFGLLLSSFSIPGYFVIHLMKQWHSETKTFVSVTKHDNLQLIKSIEVKVEAGSTNDDDRDSRIKLLQEVDILDTCESFYLFQKARVKWDIKGVHYKIIAKILANRLAKVIDKIVSHEQSAFIVGRQILDGPLILSEIVEWFKKEKKMLLIFKVDFEKAFDSASWKYLDFVLLNLGFGSKWRSWIRACLSSSSASVLVNGSPTLEFSIKRELRQGDLLMRFLALGWHLEEIHVTSAHLKKNG